MKLFIACLLMIPSISVSAYSASETVVSAWKEDDLPVFAQEAPEFSCYGVMNPFFNIDFRHTFENTSTGEKLVLSSLIFEKSIDKFSVLYEFDFFNHDHLDAHGQLIKSPYSLDSQLADIRLNLSSSSDPSLSGLLSVGFTSKTGDLISGELVLSLPKSKSETPLSKIRSKNVDAVLKSADGSSERAMKCTIGNPF